MNGRFRFFGSSLSSSGDPMEEFYRRLEAILNLVMELRQSKARVRGLVALFLLLLIWAGIGLIRHPITNLPDMLFGLISPAVIPEGISTFDFVFLPVLKVFFSADVLVHVIAMVLPFIIALEFASIYQTDIYELPKTGTARTFIMRAAFAFPPYRNLVIQSEQLTNEQKRSPIIQIGGPGIVSPDLEFNCVFERMDGSPHFIRADMTKDERRLEGFERLRRILDSRDHTFHYDEIFGRTKDGIKVQIQDIKLLFSIWRSTNGNLANPYPTNERDIFWLTYQLTEGYWVNAMTDLVRDTMLRFIQRYTFGALLAAVGEPEIRRQIELQSSIQYSSWREPLRRPLAFIYTKDLPKPPSPPPFLPRPQLSNFFKGFAEEFPLVARSRGLQLEWINVGTWDTQEAVILEQHIEAWQLTNENLARRNKRVLDELRNQSRSREVARMIRECPLLAFAQLASSSKPRKIIVYELIREYNNKLRLVQDQFNREKRPVPRTVTRALEHIRAYQMQYKQEQGASFLGGNNSG